MPVPVEVAVSNSTMEATEFLTHLSPEVQPALLHCFFCTGCLSKVGVIGDTEGLTVLRLLCFVFCSSIVLHPLFSSVDFWRC